MAHRQRKLSLDRYLKKRKLPRRVVLLLALFLIGVGSWYDHHQQRAEIDRYQSIAYRVVRVVDGDTLDVLPAEKTSGQKPGAAIRVRLWGIDCPELAKDWADPPITQSQPFAQEAYEYALEHCLNQVVHLGVEEARLRGKYGRLLAYVTLPDGRVLNESLLAEGLARFDPRFAHTQYKRYQAMEKQAQSDRVGLWARP